MLNISSMINILGLVYFAKDVEVWFGYSIFNVTFEV